MWRAPLLSLICASAALAQVPTTGPGLTDLVQARGMAMGGAGEALGYGAEVIEGNPAALTLYRRYQIELSGDWDVPLGYGQASVAVADSTSQVAAGIAYHFVTYGGANRRWAHLTTFSLALPLSDAIHLGVAVRHQIITGATNTNSVTTTAGIVIRPVSFLTLGFSGHNLIYNYNPDITRYFVASVAAQFAGQLSPAFDLRMDFNGTAPRLAYMGGIEWLIGQVFPVRFGYEHDDITHHRYLGMGIGYFQQGSGIDLSYRHELGGDKGQLLSLTIKVQL